MTQFFVVATHCCMCRLEAEWIAHKRGKKCFCSSHWALSPCYLCPFFREKLDDDGKSMDPKYFFVLQESVQKSRKKTSCWYPVLFPSEAIVSFNPYLFWDSKQSRQEEKESFACFFFQLSAVFWFTSRNGKLNKTGLNGPWVNRLG